MRIPETRWLRSAMLTAVLGWWGGQSLGAQGQVDQTEAPADLRQQIESILPTAADQAFREIPWSLNLMQARAEAASQAQPIFLWLMNGHPFGCT